jgi:excisionase family DNA binding protein
MGSKIRRASCRRSPKRLQGMGDVLSVQEAARILSVCKNSLYAAIERNEIPVVRIGRRILVPRIAIEQLLRSGLSKAAGSPPHE